MTIEALAILAGRFSLVVAMLAVFAWAYLYATRGPK